ncbi:MAG: RlmE family RNA methyltransferase [Candidatus Bathyarchaeia archaeon]
MSGRWKEERKRDPYRRMARRLGYRSRAAFKLKEMDKRFGFFKGAKVVLDLGAAPGGWLQVASEAVGREGLVIGVDLKPIKPLGLENVKTVVGDISEDSTLEEVRRLLPEPVDVLLSDLSPQISGAWDVDQFLQIELTRSALRFAEEFLKPDGWIVLKLFQGADFQGFLGDLRGRLGFVKTFKPKASRKGSSEIYVIGRYLKRDEMGGET